MVEQVCDIDVDLIADRDNAGKADAALRGQSTMPAAIAPDCEISARFPAPGMCAAKLALRLTPGIMMPRQLGPISRMPYLRAAAVAAS